MFLRGFSFDLLVNLQYFLLLNNLNEMILKSKEQLIE